MSKVFVKVCGTTGSGKTLVSVVIEKALREAGFDVKPFNNMDDDADTKRQWVEDGLLKVEEIAFKTEIEISEVQLTRSSSE
jgi:Ni2+-binding GTPase involved in maturation of urease and hydrogenase